MATETTVWTPERVRALPEAGDGKRYECVDGELYVNPAPRPAHQLLLDELSRLLYPYVREHALGLLVGREADVSLDAAALLVPDLIVLPPPLPWPLRSWSQVTALRLAVEVLSPSTARRDRGVKRERYQRWRVPEYWIVDLDARLVERWRPDDERPEVLRDSLVWHPDPSVPSLVLTLPTLFDEVERWTGDGEP